MENFRDYQWSHKYRPREVEDLIATDEVKRDVEQILKNGRAPNMLLVGPSGIGKTTIALLLGEKLGADTTMINASLKGNIDTLRNEILQFAGTVSLSGNHKYVILDEADYLNPQSTQPALRNFIDTYTENCGFWLTANYGNKIIEPLRRRLEIHEFKILKSDLPKLVMQMTKRCEEILTREGIDYDKVCLARFVATHAPNWRTVLIELQRYARRNGRVDSGILSQSGASNLDALIPLFKKKDYAGLRRWIGENADSSAQELFTELVEVLEPHVDSTTLPALIIICARYAYQSAFVADQQINFAAAMAEILAECLFS